MESSTSPEVRTKGGICVKCRVYLPAECFISSDGVDGGTVCNRHEHEAKGLRYCRGCEDFVALDLFPKYTKRFACRKHMNIFGGIQKSKRKHRADPDNRRRHTQYVLCYRDNKKFKHDTPSMGKGEIELEIRKIDKEGVGNYAVMPVDAKIATSPTNIAVVTLQQRKDLFKLIKLGDNVGYTQMLTDIQRSYE